MKTNKKGISLIVLIITIVVIIILAAAIILNLSKTNVVTNARTAVSENDRAEMQSAVNLKYADIFAEKLDKPTAEEIVSGYPTTGTQKISGLAADGFSIGVTGTSGVKFIVDNNYVVTAAQ